MTGKAVQTGKRCKQGTEFSNSRIQVIQATVDGMVNSCTAEQIQSSKSKQQGQVSRSTQAEGGIVNSRPNRTT
ncbi:MAG: hypothetical protein AAFU83_01325, partial [Bacteroidota bacterium]